MKKAITNIEQTVNTFDLPKEEDLSLSNADTEFDSRIQISESDGWTYRFDKLLTTTTTSLTNLSEKEIITNKYSMPRYYQVFLEMLPIIALWSRILPLPDSKPEESFLQCDILQTNCHAELFFRTKKLDQSELKVTNMQYIRRSYERKAGAQRQFVESAVKQTEIKNSRLCTKIKKTLNQSRIIRKVSKDVNSDNESSWEDLDINGFEQSQQEQKSPINLRRKTSYL